MTLHENKEAFSDAIRATSDYLGIREVFVEKDYWVTFILKRLSHSENKDKVVFKGGTSLSKVFGLIERFSEDVDLAIIKEADQSKYKIGKLIKSIQEELTAGFREIATENTSQKKNFRKNEYEYDEILEAGVDVSANVLVPQSTMIEKILSIIRLSYFPDSIDRIKGKARHFYDIYFLATSEHCKEYISTKAFKDDFERMYLEDKTKFDTPED